MSYMRIGGSSLPATIAFTSATGSGCSTMLLPKMTISGSIPAITSAVASRSMRYGLSGRTGKFTTAKRSVTGSLAM